MAAKTPAPGPPEDADASAEATPPEQPEKAAPAPRDRPSRPRKKSPTGGKTSGGKAATGSGAGTRPAGGAKTAAAGAKPPRKRAPRKPATEAVSKATTAATGAAESVEQTAVTAPLPASPAVATETSGDATSPAASVPEAGETEAVPGRTTTAPAAGVARALAPVGRALTSRRAPRIRTGVALFLVVVSVLAVLVSTLALWSRGIIFDTETYVKVVAPVAEDPQVREAVSAYVAGKAVEAADLSARIEDALPSDAKVLAPALTRSLQTFLVDEIDKFLGTPLAQRLWVDINRFAHEQLITALRDENRYVTVGRNDVKLNLLPLVAVALQRLEDRIPQLLGKDVTLPKIDPATAPDEIRTLLQDALGRKLPADFGTITLLRGSQGYEAKQALRLFNDLVILVVVLTVVLIAAALLVSVRRWRTALWLGVGSLLAFVAARVIEVRLEEAVVGGVKTQGGAAVARSIVNSAISSLNGFLVWVAVAGALVAVAAFLAGRPEWLEAMGRGFAKLFGVASDLSTPDTAAGRWMAEHLDLLRIAGVAVAIVVLLFVTGSLTAVVVVLIALAVYELALSAYAVGVPRELDEDPDDDPESPVA